MIPDSSPICPSTPGPLTRVAGLDSLRFIAALLVVLTHSVVQPDLLHWFHLEGVSAARLINGIYWKFFYTGSAGVIIFFLISGFCIHFPYADSLQIPSLKSYFLRRFLRIGLPVLPILLYYRIHEGIGFIDIFAKTVLWSIACETIYYTLYPALLKLRRRMKGWKWLIAAAFLAAAGVAMSDPTSKSYWAFGPNTTWLVGLPCWILGAALAEDVKRSTHPRVSNCSIWLWRAGIWSLAAACVAMTFRGPFGDPWTLNLFSIPAYFWLKREIGYFQHAKPFRLLESAGAWSYSLYITHTILWAYWKSDAGISVPPSPFQYFASLAVLLAGAYLYFLLIEAPSHLLSRKIAQRVTASPLDP